MTTFQEDTTEFHRAFGHPAPVFPVSEWTPELEQLMRDRAKWIHEEADELLEAVDEKDLIKALDALGDAGYFAVGGFTVLGHPMQSYWTNIHAANMDKLDLITGKPVPHPTIPNKIGKREGWVPPEAAHQEVFNELIADRNQEALARQVAYAMETAPDEPLIVVDALLPQQLVEALFRASEIRAAGDAVKLYFEMVNEIPSTATSDDASPVETDYTATSTIEQIP